MAAEPLRVLLVPSAYYPHTGGIEETTRRLALEFQRRGHRALVVTNRWPKGTLPREHLGGVEVRRLRLELPGRTPRAMAGFAAVAPHSAFEFLRLSAAFRPDLVHVHGAGPNAVYVAFLRRLIGTPVVFSAHGEFRNDAHEAFERSRALRWALRTLLRRAAAVTAPSQVVLDELADEFVLAAPASVVPNAVDLSEFAGERSSAPHADGYLFAAGRLVRQKGLDLLLRAYAGVRPQLGRRRLVIAGEGPERADLARLASGLGLGDSVSFPGAVDRPRLAELMQGAELFAFPSRQEAFGIALLEAMAAGTPAVATSVGGIPEFASDGRSAVLVSPNDPDALGAALVRVATDEELRRRLVEGGRAVAARLSWSRLVPRYEELYAEVADG